MLLSMKHRALCSTTLVLVLAASPLAFAGVAASNPDASGATAGRAGVQTSLSSEPTRPPQVLTDAYEWTKASVARAYEKTKEFLVESAQGQASKQQAAQTGQEEIGAGGPVSSGAGIGGFGRAGAQNYSGTDQTSQPPPQVLGSAYDKTKAYVKHAYETTKEFLAQSTQPPTTEQPTSLGRI